MHASLEIFPFPGLNPVWFKVSCDLKSFNLDESQNPCF